MVQLVSWLLLVATTISLVSCHPHTWYNAPREPVQLHNYHHQSPATSNYNNNQYNIQPQQQQGLSVQHPLQPANTGQISLLPASSAEQQANWDNQPPLVIRTNSQPPNPRRQSHSLHYHSHSPPQPQRPVETWYVVDADGQPLVNTHSAPRQANLDYRSLLFGNARRLEEPFVTGFDQSNLGSLEARNENTYDTVIYDDGGYGASYGPVYQADQQQQQQQVEEEQQQQQEEIPQEEVQQEEVVVQEEQQVVVQEEQAIKSPPPPPPPRKVPQPPPPPRKTRPQPPRKLPPPPPSPPPARKGPPPPPPATKLPPPPPRKLPPPPPPATKLPPPPPARKTPPPPPPPRKLPPPPPPRKVPPPPPQGTKLPPPPPPSARKVPQFVPQTYWQQEKQQQFEFAA